MIGYYSESCPVKTTCPNVLATVYQKMGESLIAMASWDDEPVQCKLLIDWEMLGIDKENAILEAPAIEEFQKKSVFSPLEEISVQPGKGWLMILRTE